MPGPHLGKLLIVDDEIELLNSLAEKLTKQGFETVKFSSPREALQCLETRNFDLLLTDLMMPEMDGISLLQAARRLDPYLAGVVMTGQATVQTAIDALKLGALDYILKPFTIATILPALARALETRRLRLENIQLRETLGIYELCNAIAFTLDYQTLLNKIVDAAMQQCEAEEASIMLVADKDNSELFVATVRGEGRGHLLGERVPLGLGIAGWVAIHREPVTVLGEVVDSRFAPIQPRPDIRCAISIPMMVGGQLVGVLNVSSTTRRHPYTMGQVKALGILANTGAAALKSSKLHVEVQKAEEQYRSIFENATEGILQSTPEGQVIIANPAVARMLGYDSPEDFQRGVRNIGIQVYHRIQDRSEIVRRMETEGRIKDIELQMVRKDGAKIWVSLNGRVVRDTLGNIVRYESTIGDITRRKLAERRSAAEHNVARILASASSVAEALSRTLQTVSEALEWEWCCVWRIDDEDQVLHCSELWYPPDGWDEFGSYCRTATFTRLEGLPGRAWALRQPVWIPDITREADFLGASQAVKAGYRSAVAIPILADSVILGVVQFFGREVREPDPLLLTTLIAIGNQLGQYIERRRIEEERDRFFELSVDLLCIAGFDGKFRIINSAWTATLGWLPEEFVTRPYIDFVHPEDRAATLAEAERLAATGGCTLSFDNRYRCKDGSYRWLSWRAVTDLSRKSIYASARDTTEMRRTEQKIRSILESAPDAMIIANAVGEITLVNNQTEAMFGYGREEILGKQIEMLMPERYRERHVSHREQFIHNPRIRRMGAALELFGQRKDGGEFPVEISLSPLETEEDVLTVSAVRDVTQSKSLEKQLRQAQKMDAIGKLAGGVAHDFNNLLTIISGYSDMLLQSLDDSDPNRELVAEIYHAGERSAGLTRQLLAFSRQQILTLKVLDLNKIVADAEKMLRRLIGENIRLSTSLSAGLWPIRADAGQIEQILLNLAVNARDAMADGGRLTMETQNVVLDQTYAESRADVSPGQYVLLAVSDTGCGMSPEVMARIFEPFFTTKEPGKGTGLGLATVHGIVKQSAGHIGVYSEVGIGTTFKIYLPRAEGSNSGTHDWPRTRKPDRGIETILLVEDEDRVRAFSKHILVGCGYRVLEAVDGEQAIEVATKYADHVHLLITDVIMPKAGGRAVANGVAKLKPGIRVLFVSGYTDDSVVRHGVLEEGVNFLQKPFSPASLAQKVREVLDMT